MPFRSSLGCGLRIERLKCTLLPLNNLRGLKRDKGGNAPGYHDLLLVYHLKSLLAVLRMLRRWVQRGQVV